MLVLGSMLSTVIWYRLIVRQQGSRATRQQGKEAINESLDKNPAWSGVRKREGLIWGSAYVVVTALAFHANYLMALTVAGQVIWGSVVVASRQSISKLRFQIRDLAVPAGVLLATAALCVPIVWHFLRHRTSVFQGLDWIARPTFGGAMKVLGEVSFGPVWVWALLVPAVIAWGGVAKTPKRQNAETPKPGGGLQASEPTMRLVTSPHRHVAILPHSSGVFSLLLIWLGAAWGGLLVISWMAHPAMVLRYALPAAAPAILLPLIVLRRFDRRLPLLVAGLFVAGTAPAWTGRIDQVQAGFREMVAFLDEYADPQREAIVAVVERTSSPGWEEMDLLGFEYYRSSKFEIRSSKKGSEATRQPGGRDNEATRQPGNGQIEILPHYDITTLPPPPTEVLYLRNGQPDGDQPILRDSRALWLVTFLADPTEALRAAGRRVEQIEIEGKLFDQLYFEPYRLIRVAAMK